MKILIFLYNIVYQTSNNYCKVSHVLSLVFESLLLLYILSLLVSFILCHIVQDYSFFALISWPWNMTNFMGFWHAWYITKVRDGTVMAIFFMTWNILGNFYQILIVDNIGVCCVISLDSNTLVRFSIIANIDKKIIS